MRHGTTEQNQRHGNTEQTDSCRKGGERDSGGKKEKGLVKEHV